MNVKDGVMPIHDIIDNRTRELAPESLNALRTPKGASVSSVIQRTLSLAHRCIEVYGLTEQEIAVVESLTTNDAKRGKRRERDSCFSWPFACFVIQSADAEIDALAYELRPQGVL